MNTQISVDPETISVLVVDDEATILKIIQRSLASTGYRIHLVSDAESAIEFLRKERSDVVITDIAMPGMDGFELTKHILGSYSSAVIVMTGQIDVYRYDQFVGIGASDFLEKPFTPEEIVLRVNRVLRERKVQEELIQSHNQQAQNQKLEALGQISAGIVHEIKTPVQYITDNIGFIKETFEQMDTMIKELITLYQAVMDDSLMPDLLERIRSQISLDELDYLREETPQAIDQSLEGIRQINRIISSMKSFTHPGKQDHETADINSLVKDAVAISKHEWKHTATISATLDKTLPAVRCHPGELTQVLINLIVNACHAISEKREQNNTDGFGNISIRTAVEESSVMIRVRDNGIGIPEDILPQIYDPFFTTKEIGKGTGQGLAITRSIVVDRHKGRLEVETQSGQGAAFNITLPLYQDGSP